MKIRSKRRIQSFLLLVFWDFIAVFSAVYLSFKLKFGFVRELPAYYLEHQVIFIWVTFAMAVGFHLLVGVYRPILRHFSLDDILRILFSVLLTVATQIILDRFLGLGIPMEIVVMEALLLFTLYIGGRLSGRMLDLLSDKFSVERMDTEHILVYGAGELGAYLIQVYAQNHRSQLTVAALVDDNPALLDLRISGIRIQSAEKLDELLGSQKIDRVILAINHPGIKLIQRTAALCSRFGVKLSRFGMVGDVDDLAVARVYNVTVEDLLHRESVHLNMEIVREMLNGKTVLVTGGAGSIGSEICRQVLRMGARKLIAVDFNENGLFQLDRELKKNNADWRYVLALGSIRDQKRMEEFFQCYRPEVVIHAAAHKHVPMMQSNPKEAVKNNVFGTMIVSDLAAEYQSEHFILISTDKAVNPANVMGASKRIAELIIQKQAKENPTVKFAAVRFGNVLGSVGSVVPTFQEQIAAGGPVTVTHPDMVRYFMTIPEAVQLVLEAGAMSDGGEIFVLDMGKPIRIYDLAQDMIRLSGLQPEIDIKIEVTGIRNGEKMYEEISLAEESCCKTAHDKIYINHPAQLDLEEFDREISKLGQALHADEDVLFQAIRRIVPSFPKPHE